MTADDLMLAVAGPIAGFIMFGAVVLLGIDIVREIGR